LEFELKVSIRNVTSSLIIFFLLFQRPGTKQINNLRLAQHIEKWVSLKYFPTRHFFSFSEIIMKEIPDLALYLKRRIRSFKEECGFQRTPNVVGQQQKDVAEATTVFTGNATNN